MCEWAHVERIYYITYIKEWRLFLLGKTRYFYQAGIMQPKSPPAVPV